MKQFWLYKIWREFEENLISGMSPATAQGEHLHHRYEHNVSEVGLKRIIWAWDQVTVTPYRGKLLLFLLLQNRERLQNWTSNNCHWQQLDAHLCSDRTNHYSIAWKSLSPGWSCSQNCFSRSLYLFPPKLKTSQKKPKFNVHFFSFTSIFWRQSPWTDTYIQAHKYI